VKQWLNQTLHGLNLVNNMNQPEGFTRLGYTLLENQSIAFFEQTAKSLGLMISNDPAGNVIATWPADSSLPAVAVGSHLDTVSHGGGYDGVAGVLCALGAIKQLKQEGYQPSHPIEVIVFRSEEASRFGISTIGSKAMSGILDLEIGHVKDRQGISIKDAVEQLDFNWEDFLKAERKKDEIKSFVELHIEQGVVIEENNKSYGVVRGVACPVRLKIKVTGKAGHTGTTPMGKRKDALVAIAPLINFVSESAFSLSQTQPIPVVATVSKIEAMPNSMTIIPSQVELGIDIRSVDDNLKRQVEHQISDKCVELEKIYKVSIQIEKLVDNPSVLLDVQLQTKLTEVGERLGYSSIIMDSGAGHDVMNMAIKWPSGLLFIPCRDGISHHPDEFASLEDLELGVELLAKHIETEAKAP
jgi:hydantoinase/carbamoylase family amidase